MKGIILAGGTGTRLAPLTHAVSKQLMPVYDKPMVYYPLSVLMLAGIRQVLIIVSPGHEEAFRTLLGDGSHLGLRIEYRVQPSPRGIAEAFLIGERFIGQDAVALILGDNIFYGHGLPECLQRAMARQSGATIFAYQVREAQRYGVVEFDAVGQPLGLEEKPAHPRSHYAVTGLYVYDHRVARIAARLAPSARGELEITDLNRAYLDMKELHVEKLGRGIAWLDTGTYEALLQASHFIEVLEQRQGLVVACLEEIAYRLGYINARQLRQLSQPLKQSPYGRYLLNILDEQ